MKCKYCGVSFSNSEFGEYHDKGCSIQGAIKIGNAARLPEEVSAEPVITTDPVVKKKRGRPRKVNYEKSL